MLPTPPPTDYPRVRRVDSFDELASVRFADGVNALWWPRVLAGDFTEIIDHVTSTEPLVSLDETFLETLPLSPNGRLAANALIADLGRLRRLALDPVLNCIHGYPRDDSAGPVPTDVFSYHADSANTEADTWLCTYLGSPSEGLRHEDAVRRVDDPATRAALLADYGGADDDGFREFLNDHCYDLHYAPRPGATPFSFGHFNFWRITTDYPGSPVPPCVHRAPATIVGQPRLLLIS